VVGPQLEVARGEDDVDVLGVEDDLVALRRLLVADA
jgi:hypothetical protein